MPEIVKGVKLPKGFFSWVVKHKVSWAEDKEAAAFAEIHYLIPVSTLRRWRKEFEE